jgi:erythronate-4-phosphate dehydrogenase
MIKIIADAAIPFLKGVLEPYAEVTYLPAPAIDAATVRDADALMIRTRTKINEQLLDGSAVRFVATATIGFDHIDTGFCDKNGIRWVNAPGCNAGSVQQYIAAALLALEPENPSWLTDKTIGIIGVGHVGSKVEQLARTLGMNVLLNDPPRERREGPGKFVSLETLLGHSDIVTLHVPLNITGPDRTLHLINHDTLSLLRKGVRLINTSRGEVVDTAAVKAALQSQHIAGAVFDVWENEPHPDPELIRQAHIATPHIAGYSLDGKANGTAMSVQALARFFGLPLENWFPTELGQAGLRKLTLSNPEGLPLSQVREAIRQTCDIGGDDARFRQDPASFESQRNNYPPRREFQAFSIHTASVGRESSEILKKLGFNLVQ